MCGVQRIYLGQTGLGLAMLFTLGFCGLGQLFDLFLIAHDVDQFNNKQQDSSLASDYSTVNRSRKPLSQANSHPLPDDELDSLLKEAQHSFEQTQTYQKPTDHHGS